LRGGLKREGKGREGKERKINEKGRVKERREKLHNSQQIEIYISMRKETKIKSNTGSAL
jgi:hypothetical protein